MKLEEKGLATVAIVGIVVAVVVVVVVAVAAVLLLGGGRPAGVGGLPLYAGATRTDSVPGMGSSSNVLRGVLGRGSDVPSGFQAEVYTATGSVSEIMNYYRTEMANAGWTKQYDNTFSYSFMDVSMIVGLLYFEKGNRAAAVYAFSYTYEGETYLSFALVEGPKAVFDQWISEAGYELEEEEEEEEEEGGIAGATSLDYKVEYTYAEQALRYRYRARNINTANMDMRVDWTADGRDFSYILNGSQRKVWVFSDDEWIDMSELPGFDFNMYWGQYYAGYETYTGYLSGWTSGEWSGTFGDVTYRIYDIQVNPTLPDSVFQPG